MFTGAGSAGISHRKGGRGRGPEELRDDEAGYVGWPDSREGIGRGSRQRDRRIGERGGRRKPVRADDVRSDRERNDSVPTRTSPVTTSRPNVATSSLKACGKPERGWRRRTAASRTSSAQRRRRATHRLSARRYSWQPRARARPLGTLGERNDRVEVRAGDWTEGENQRDERGSGRQRVCQERDGGIASGEPSPMIPEPTTAASRNAVPRASATNARECTTAPLERAHWRSYSSHIR